LMQRDADGEYQGEHFETVERPPEVRGDKGLPLRPAERAIPWRGRDGCEFAHDSPPKICLGMLAGSARMKPTLESRGLGRALRLAHVLGGEPVPSPDQVRARLSPEHAPALRLPDGLGSERYDDQYA